MIDEGGPAAAHGFSSNCAVLGLQPEPYEALGQLAVGLLSDEFVARVAPPEINAADLKKLARGAAEQVDQSGGVDALRSLGGDAQEQFLKGIVGVGQGAAFGRLGRIASDHLQRVTTGRDRIFTILTSD